MIWGSKVQSESVASLILEREEAWLSRRDIAPLRERLKHLPQLEGVSVGLEGEAVSLFWGEIKEEERQEIYECAKALMPWRKGPFWVGDFLIDSEWVSAKKYALLEPHFDLRNKDVADIGCNNGYYMFRMWGQKPKSLTGFDPSPLCRTQFDFINHFIQAPIRFELLGVEHLEGYGKLFDVIFCLGVLYHRSDPIQTLKSLYKGLAKGGELLLDTLMIEGEEEVALTPKDRYAKMSNVYFIPTFKALSHWLHRAGFERVEKLEIAKTGLDEQRKTEWINSQSLEDFLDPCSHDRTIEGYPAPRRIYVKAYKGA